MAVGLATCLKRLRRFITLAISREEQAEQQGFRFAAMRESDCR